MKTLLIACLLLLSGVVCGQTLIPLPPGVTEAPVYNFQEWHQKQNQAIHDEYLRNEAIVAPTRRPQANWYQWQAGATGCYKYNKACADMMGQ